MTVFTSYRTRAKLALLGIAKALKNFLPWITISNVSYMSFTVLAQLRGVNIALTNGKSRGSQDCSFKCLLRDTLHIFGKSEDHSLQKKREIYLILRKKLDLVIWHLGELEDLSFHIQSSGVYY